ncbi:MAG: MarR family transcriptional regulator [bacterium]
MALKDEVLNKVRMYPGKTDRELTNMIFGPGNIQQPVNQAANALEKKGFIMRRNRPSDNRVGNYPVSAGGNMDGGKILPPVSPTSPVPEGKGFKMSEDEAKKILKEWLEKQGWTTTVVWGRKHGIDILAEKKGKRWIIEVKGSGSRNPMRVNYFLSIIGETLQRMNDSDSKYSIAFPDMRQFRNLWARLPELAKTRTTISVLFVRKDGSVEEVL